MYAYAEGWALRKAGELAGVTHEGVRVMLKRRGLPLYGNKGDRTLNWRMRRQPRLPCARGGCTVEARPYHDYCSAECGRLSHYRPLPWISEAVAVLRAGGSYIDAASAVGFGGREGAWRISIYLRRHLVDVGKIRTTCPRCGAVLMRDRGNAVCHRRLCAECKAVKVARYFASAVHAPHADRLLGVVCGRDIRFPNTTLTVASDPAQVTCRLCLRGKI